MEKYHIENIAGYLAKGFLSNPLTPILAVALLLLGLLSLEVMPREEDPQIEVSGGSVIVAIPGATPSEINNVIIKPLERHISEIKGIEHIYGVAMHNMGMINVQYYIGEDRESSNLKLYDKVMQNMDKLPKGITLPLVKPFDIDIDIPILTLAFYKMKNKKLDTIKFYQTIRELQQDINALDNVAKTTLKGVKKPQFNVLIDLDKLSPYNISLSQVTKAIQSIAKNTPEIDTETSKGKLIVFGVQNALNSVEDLNELIIAEYGGSLIYLRDIAKVEYNYDIQNFDSVSLKYQKNLEDKNSSNTPLFEDAGEQVTMTISKLKGTNAVDIAGSVMKKIASMKAGLQKEGIGFIVTRNYGTRANEAVNELVHHLTFTILFIAFILIPFLGWRESAVVMITVPMILAATLFIALMVDQTINRITLFAFLLSLGLIVDDAIIVIENIHRRLRLEESQEQEFDEIIIQATDEIGPSTNIATIAIMLTMIPMAFVGGMMGQFMKPIPLNVPVALGISLFVAYVFAPYLARKFIKFKGKKIIDKEEVIDKGEM